MQKCQSNDVKRRVPFTYSATWLLVWVSDDIHVSRSKARNSLIKPRVDTFHSFKHFILTRILQIGKKKTFFSDAECINKYLSIEKHAGTLWGVNLPHLQSLNKLKLSLSRFLVSLKLEQIHLSFILHNLPLNFIHSKAIFNNQTSCKVNSIEEIFFSSRFPLNFRFLQINLTDISLYWQHRLMTPLISVTSYMNSSFTLNSALFISTRHSFEIPLSKILSFRSFITHGVCALMVNWNDMSLQLLPYKLHTNPSCSLRVEAWKMWKKAKTQIFIRVINLI